MQNCFTSAGQRGEYVGEADIALPNTERFNATIGDVVRSVHRWPLLLTRVEMNVGAGIGRKERTYETRIWGRA